MALSDSTFLVEIIVEEMKSFVTCKEFLIKSQFADIFSIALKDHKELEKVMPKIPGKKVSKRKKARRSGSLFSRYLPETKIYKGQSVIAVDNIENLILNMKKNPIELSLWSRYFPEYKVASTNIAWNIAFIDYVKNINIKRYPQPVSVKGEYNVFDEVTSRRMAVIKLNIKMSYITDEFRNQFSSLCEDNPSNFFTGFSNSKLNIVSNITTKKLHNFYEETGIIKTIYSGGNKKLKKHSRSRAETLKDSHNISENPIKNIVTPNIINDLDTTYKTPNTNINSFKSDMNINKRMMDLVKSKSCSSINQDHLNLLGYIFGNKTGPFGSQVYCVRYFTVENDHINSPKSSKTSPLLSKSGSPTVSNPESSKASDNIESSRKSSKLKLCDKDCLNERIDTGSCNLSICSLDVPNDTEISKCKQIKCEHKTFRKLPSPPDDRILVDLTHLKEECCMEKYKEGRTAKGQNTEDKDKKGNAIEKMEEVVGGIKAKLKIGEDPCYCECECKFGFIKKTKYCKVCGGFETLGENFKEQQQLEIPFPCPTYHKLMDKAKIKPSTTGSDSKRLSKKKSVSGKSIESEKESKKAKKKKKDDKFKFNYGYTGIPPHIGHSRCALPCNGTFNQVPKNMGWLWTADNVPGMKFRALWKPGAINKHVLRLLKIAKNPDEAFAKKKRKKDTGKTKRPLKRPLLIIHKKDGEFTVTMETMKTYNKPRTVNQVPYEDKPPLTYTIGRTDEENRERRKKKERAQRRVERCQRKFIQSAFRDMCEEICLKTYQQALGILPDTEKPDCICYPTEPGPDRTDLDYSCSCSEDSQLMSSDTDSDEWFVEFTPPAAKFDQSFKCKKIQYAESSTQYTYLDYRVKLLDRFGNPVPRFFKGPDGKEQCSDLGGFWGPDNKWLEINIDGYVAPDGKWAPNIFCGPNGEQVDAETGKFQAMDGTWLVVGIDGYVDSQGKWRFYTKSRAKADRKKCNSTLTAKQGAGDRKETPLLNKNSQGTWSCFGDATPKQLSRMGIVGHGHDRKLLVDTLKKLISQGEDVKLPEPSSLPRSPKKNREKRLKFSSNRYDSVNGLKCKHPTPSDKGIVAVDAHGNKTYFKLREYRNKRPKHRLAILSDQGISISSFHVPCFHSFISSEIMKKERYDRLVALAQGHGQDYIN